MKPYPIQLEISGPIALWARPDTMPNPVSYVAPTFSAAKGIFEAILRWKSVNVRPTRARPRATPSRLSWKWSSAKQ
jgi:CRISPR-associated protein Cas5d